MARDDDDKGFTPLMDHHSDGETSDEFSCPRCRHQRGGQHTPWSSLGVKLVLVGLVAATAIVTGLALTVFGWVYNEHKAFTDSQHHTCNLPTDSMFGEIPWRTMIINQDPRFNDLTVPGTGGHSQNPGFVWSDIIPTTMVAVPNPKQYGLSGGGRDWENPEEFDDETEAYTVTIMHQLHCLADFKTHFLTFRNNSVLSDGDFAHLSHCVEIVRRGVMCKADLALETPDDPKIWPRQHVSGWGNPHVCRDWDMVMSAIKKHAITRGETGWRRVREDDPPLIVA